jgi:hypothetical protein
MNGRGFETGSDVHRFGQNFPPIPYPVRTSVLLRCRINRVRRTCVRRGSCTSQRHSSRRFHHTPTGKRPRNKRASDLLPKHLPSLPGRPLRLEKWIPRVVQHGPARSTWRQQRAWRAAPRPRPVSSRESGTRCSPLGEGAPAYRSHWHAMMSLLIVRDAPRPMWRALVPGIRPHRPQKRSGARAPPRRRGVPARLQRRWGPSWRPPQGTGRRRRSPPSPRDRGLASQARHRPPANAMRRELMPLPSAHLLPPSPTLRPVSGRNSTPHGTGGTRAPIQRQIQPRPGPGRACPTAGPLSRSRPRPWEATGSLPARLPSAACLPSTRPARRSGPAAPRRRRPRAP